MLETSGGAEIDVTEPLFGPDLLIIDHDEAAKQIARNWGFILLSGSMSFAAGLWAFCVPLLATEAAHISTAVTLLAVGLLNVVGSFYVEKGYKLQSFILGSMQLALGAIMEAEPILNMAALTLIIAGTVFVDGLYRLLLAAQNRRMQRWWGVLLSGLASVAGSVYVVKFLPLSAAYVPGLALGCSLLSGGLARILVSLAGRDLANAQMA